MRYWMYVLFLVYLTGCTEPRYTCSNCFHEDFGYYGYRIYYKHEYYRSRYFRTPGECVEDRDKFLETH